MNNKNYGCQSGCGQSAYCPGGSFVPVSGNWDFNVDDCCTRRRNACETAQQPCPRNTKPCAGARQEDGCQEKGCQEKQHCPQAAARCEKNTCTGKADCACDACMAARSCSGRNKNRGVGIMWGKLQEIDTIYDAEHALLAGTLYPELHKPLNGYWPCEENCADCAQEAAFVLWELRLYLNTHPCDKEALALFRQLCEKAEGTYAAAFLPKDCARWAWTDDPWPWEYDCSCNK